MSTSNLHLGIFFYMPWSYDMGPTPLLPLRRKACWGIFRPKNPTASTGCETANLGTKGQHATLRPLKPLNQRNTECVSYAYRSLNATVTQTTNCPIVVSTTIELKSIITTSDNTGIKRGMFQLTSVPVLWDVVLIFSKWAILGVMPLLHSVSDMASSSS